MNQITRLRQRLKNAGKNVTEYKMSITEARELVAEIDKLEREALDSKTSIKTNQNIITPLRHIDGSHF